MKRFVPVLAFLFLYTPAHINAGLRDEVICPYVEIRAGDSLGSGTVIKVNGRTLVLTACHVVDEAMGEKETEKPDGKGGVVKVKQIEYQSVGLLYQRDGRMIWQRAEIVYYTLVEEKGGHDLALLAPAHPEDLDAAAVDTESALEPGEDCWYMGTNFGCHGSLEKTIINRPDVERDGNHYIAVNGNGWFGNSGGGVFVKRGDRYVLVGVVVRLERTGTPRTPLLCQCQKTIAAFLTEYEQQK